MGQCIPFIPTRDQAYCALGILYLIIIDRQGSLFLTEDLKHNVPNETKCVFFAEVVAFST